MKDMTSNHTDCRFFGFEPAIRASGTKGDWSVAQRAKWRADCKEAADKIKAVGEKISNYGLRTKAAAIAGATRVEKASGVEMAVFRHDYI